MCAARRGPADVDLGTTSTKLDAENGAWLSWADQETETIMVRQHNGAAWEPVDGPDVPSSPGTMLAANGGVVVGGDGWVTTGVPCG